MFSLFILSIAIICKICVNRPWSSLSLKKANCEASAQRRPAETKQKNSIFMPPEGVTDARSLAGPRRHALTQAKVLGREWGSARGRGRTVLQNGFPRPLAISPGLTRGVFPAREGTGRTAAALPTPSGSKESSGNSCCRVSGPFFRSRQRSTLTAFRLWERLIEACGGKRLRHRRTEENAGVPSGSCLSG